MESITIGSKPSEKQNAGCRRKTAGARTVEPGSCGAVYGREHEFGTREFFDEANAIVTRVRALDAEVMGFNEFSGARLLEVGCGMGTDLLQFARGGAQVTGVDLTPRSIEISRQHLELYGQLGDFAIGDGEKFPFTAKASMLFTQTACCITPLTRQAPCERFIEFCGAGCHDGG